MRHYADEAVRLFPTQTPNLGFQLGHASLGISGALKGRQPVGCQLLGRQEKLPAHRVSEAQRPFLPTELQPQCRAVPPAPSIRLLNNLHWDVFAIDQRVAGKMPVVKISTRRVEAPVFP